MSVVPRICKCWTLVLKIRSDSFPDGGKSRGILGQKHIKDIIGWSPIVLLIVVYSGD